MFSALVDGARRKVEDHGKNSSTRKSGGNESGGKGR
jgi:hypothetical protein